VIKPVLPGSTVVGIPGRIAEKHRKLTVDLEHGKLPDPVANAIKILLKRQERIENRLKRLEILKRFPLDGSKIENKFTCGDGI